MAKEQVFVIGAGAAGLAAADCLSAAGHTVTVLEARDRAGGRIHTAYPKLPRLPVELGAEFIHGDRNHVWDLATKCQDFYTTEVPDRHWEFRSGKLVENEHFWDDLASVMEKFEDIEHDPAAGRQATLVVVMVCAAGGFGAMGLGVSGIGGFVSGTIMVLGAWLVWVSAIATIGTVAFPEAQTRSSMTELLRTLGFASAPAIFLGLTAMRAAAPFIAVVVAGWMIAAAVVGMRQALDYRSTSRAIGVCAFSLLLSLALLAAVGLLFSARVN